MSVKISAMTAIGTLALEDLFEVVDNPGGTPLSRKATGQQVVDLVNSTTGLSGGTDNYIPTSDGASGWTWDANLTFDGTTLKVGSSSTITPSASADSIVIDNGAANDGITIVNSGDGIINFADAADNDAGQLSYSHNNTRFAFKVEAVNPALTLSGSLADFQALDITTAGNITTDGGYIWLNRIADNTEAYMTIATADGYDSYLTFMGTGEQVIWRWTRQATTEDLLLQRYVNNNPQDNPIVVDNGTGDITIANNLTTGGAIAADNGTESITFTLDGTETSMIVDVGDYSDNFVLGIANPARTTGDAAELRYDGNGDFTGSWNFTLPASAASVTPTLQLQITNGIIDAQDNNITTSGIITSDGGDIRVDRTGDAAVAQFNIYSDAGEGKLVASFSGSSARWYTYFGNADNETGSDAGTNWVIQRYNDSGIYQDDPFRIERSTGDVTIANDHHVVGDTYLDTAYAKRYFHGATSATDSYLYASSANDVGLVGAHFTAEYSLGLRGQRGSTCGMEASFGGGDLQIASGGVNVFNVDDSPTAQVTMANHNLVMGGDLTTTGDVTGQNINWGSDSAVFLSMSGANPYISFDTSDYLLYVQSTDTFQFNAGAATQLTLSPTTADFQDNNITTTGDIEAGGTASVRIGDDGTDPFVEFDTTDWLGYDVSLNEFNVYIGNTVQLNLSATTADFQDNDITTTGTLSVGDVGTDLISDTDSTDDLGSTGVRWANAYADEFHEPAWADYTPTITAQTGTITASSANVRYIRSGKTLKIFGTITITTKGTAAGYLQFTTPNTETWTHSSGFYANEGQTNNYTCTGYTYAGNSYCRIFGADSGTGFTTPFVADGDVFYFQITGEIN